jgi:hypothetical protein
MEGKLVCVVPLSQKHDLRPLDHIAGLASNIVHMIWKAGPQHDATTFTIRKPPLEDLADDFMSAKCPIELPVLSYSF